MDTTKDNRTINLPIVSLLKPEEIAAILRISRSFAYSLLQTGAIPTVHVGKACRVRPRDLEAYIEQNLQLQADNS